MGKRTRVAYDRWTRLRRWGSKGVGRTADKGEMKTVPVATFLELLSVVELRVECGRWPAGTRGTVVEVLDHGALVEISDDRGHTLEMLALPFDAVRVAVSPWRQQEQLAL
jgi:Domain of unknown function (DUF4926)